MAGRRLVTFVHVDGQVYGPNDDVPAEVAKRIENPDAWDGSDSDSGDEPKRATRGAKPKE